MKTTEELSKNSYNPIDLENVNVASSTNGLSSKCLENNTVSDRCTRLGETNSTSEAVTLTITEDKISNCTDQHISLQIQNNRSLSDNDISSINEKDDLANDNLVDNDKPAEKVLQISEEDTNSIPIFSVDMDNSPCKSVDNLPNVPAFKYPVPTQNKTQLQNCNQRDSIAFSQWPSDVYENADRVFSELVRKKKLLKEETSSKEEKMRSSQTCKVQEFPKNDDDFDYHKTAADTDSNVFSQWPEDVYKKIDAAVTVLENKEDTSDSINVLPGNDKSCNNSQTINELTQKPEIPPKIDSTSESRCPANMDICRNLNIKEHKVLEKDVPYKNNLSDGLSLIKSNIFGEDLSDLKPSNECGFLKASSMKKFPPENKSIAKSHNSLSFFGEDFSDLDLSSLKGQKGGFQSAAKSIECIDKTKNKARLAPVPATSSLEKLNMLKHQSPVHMKPVGFSTASGKSVDVSESSINFIRASQTSVKQKFCSGFKTAAGTNVDISESTLDFIRSSQISAPRKQKEVVTGFATGNGTVVGISKQSLNFIRSSQAPVNEKVPSGFSTASGNIVTVTEGSLDFIRSSQAPPKASDHVLIPTAKDRNKEKENQCFGNTKPFQSDFKPIYEPTSPSLDKHPVIKDIALEVDSEESLKNQSSSSNNIRNKRVRHDVINDKNAKPIENSSDANITGPDKKSILQNSLSLRKRR